MKIFKIPVEKQVDSTPAGSIYMFRVDYEILNIHTL